MKPLTLIWHAATDSHGGARFPAALRRTRGAPVDAAVAAPPVTASAQAPA